MMYDLHIHSTFSSGESTLEEIVKAAKGFGYKGIGFISYILRKEEENFLKAEIIRVSKEYNFEIYLGFEATNKLELKKLLNRRREFDLLLVRGGTNLMNRIAVENRGVDILTHPDYERKDCGINHVLARLAKEYEVAIEINFREVLNSEGLIRKNVIANHMEIIRLYKKFKFLQLSFLLPSSPILSIHLVLEQHCEAIHRLHNLCWYLISRGIFCQLH